MEQKRNLTLIDSETGEVLENVKSVIFDNEPFEKHKKMNHVNKQFIDEYGKFVFKVNSKSMQKKDDNMSNSDLAKLIYLSTYINYDNIIMSDSNKPMSKQDIKRIISVNDSIFYKWYNQMLKNGIIIESDNDISINGKYTIKGELSKNKNYNRIFINSVRAIYEANKGKNMSSLGHIFRMLPYINKFGNTICWNPQEMDENKIELVTVGELSKIFEEYEENPKKFMRTMSKYRLADGQPIMIFFNDNEDISKQNIMINPLLTYSGRNEDMKDIQSIFIMLRKKDKNNQSIIDKNSHILPKKG